jgi:hypothetical protein
MFADALSLTRKVRSAMGLPGTVQSALRVSGDVDHGHVAAFTRLAGQRITCTSGRLWVTLENVPGDHTLEPGGHLAVPADGKVVIGGKGSYRI